MKHFFNPFLRLFALSLMLVGAVACGGDDNDDTPQTKLTYISLALDTSQKGRQDASAAFGDIAGISGKTNTETITLDANSTYTGTVVAQDSSKNPTENLLTNYNLSLSVTNASAQIAVSSGSTFTVTTGAASATGVTGILLVTLAPKSGVTGTTQSVSFPLVIRE